jgi:3-oxoacyl-[acyl-carrier-protein] synthase-3
MHNSELSKLVDTTDEWIFSRTGISQRHLADTSETTSDMAVAACVEAIKCANLSKGDIDLVICATATPDLTFPSTAAIICHKLGITNTPFFDVQAVCAGFIYGLHLAESLLKSGSYKNILLIGAEKMSNIIDWQDRNTCVLFGDGAGAFVLSKDSHNFVRSVIHSDASEYEILMTTGGVGSNKIAGFASMQGTLVFKHAVEKMPAAIKELLAQNALAIDQVDYVVCHQANVRIIDHIQRALALPEDKVIKTVKLHANCSAASIPLAFASLYGQNKLKPTDLLAFAAIGAGLAWGACLIRW